jgi:hypothetical protein
MKKIFFMVFCLVSTYIGAQSSSRFGKDIVEGNLIVINEILADDSSYYRLINGIFLLNKNELRLLRNTIYAKYGYIFRSKDLQNHFSQFEWYRGTKNNVDDEFTERDKKNIGLIQKIEANYPPVQNENIVGYWLDNRGGNEIMQKAIYNGEDYVISMFPCFRIYSNGTFLISSHDTSVTGYGLWKIENNKFILTYLSEDPEYGAFNFNKPLDFMEIESPDGKKYLHCYLSMEGVLWWKLTNDPIRYSNK